MFILWKKGGEKIGLIGGLFKATALVAGVVTFGPVVAPLLLAGNMDGIDGYCDD